jgi:hypothetical protein
VQVRFSLLPGSGVCLVLSVQKFINRLVDEHLDCEQSLRRQSLVNVKKVQELVSHNRLYLFSALTRVCRR